MRKIEIYSILGISALCTGYSLSIAATYEVPASEYVLIQNERGEFRALVDFALPEGFENLDLEMAKLTVSFGPVSGGMEVWLFPVTMAWAAGHASWNIPWITPGGDYDSLHGCGMYMLKGDAPETLFTVTEALQILQHGAGYHGFILMPPPYERMGFEESLMPSFEGVSGIRLVISTRE